MNQGILKDFKPLAEVGALSRIQYLKQQQEWSAKSEADQLLQEQQRLKLEISTAKSKLLNTWLFLAKTCSHR